MKKLITLFLAFLMMVSSFTIPSAFADGGIKVVINGVEQKYDVMPVIINGRTLVPMRGIFEALGAEITWIDATKTVVGSRDRKFIKLRIDSDTVYVNGAEQEKKLDVPATIINSRTMVPVRFIAESFGETVNWNADTRTVEITSDYLNKVAVSDKLAVLPSTMHRDIPREFEKSSELGDWLYFDNGISVKEVNLSVYGNAKEMISEDEFINLASLSEKEKSYTSRYGSMEIVDVEGENFDKAIRVTTHTVPPVKTENMLYYNDILKGRFNTDDYILLTFKIRLVDGGELETASGEYVGKVYPQLQHPTTFAKTIFSPFYANKEWRTMYIPARMGENSYDLAIRFGQVGAPQTVEIADFRILNFGEKEPRDVSLPKYSGEYIQSDLEPDAQWRKDAADRIEQIRKGNFKVVVKDSAGNPVPDAKVNFDMFESAFPFGSVYQNASSDEYQENWSKYFNMAVLETNMKWGVYEENPGTARKFVDRAREAGMIYLRYHTMIYERHKHMDNVKPLIPDDVMEAIVSKDIDYVDERTKGWIYKVSDDFAGELTEIDVSNELALLKAPGEILYIGPNSDIKFHTGGYYNILGAEYYDKIYKWVDEVNPKALMFYTDSTPLSDKNRWKEADMDGILDSLYKNPNHFEAIGMHGHSSATSNSISSYHDLFNMFYEKYGAKSAITEFSVNSGNENYDGNYARDALILALANENISSFNLWGFKSPKGGSKCFVDENYNLKPAGKALNDVFYNKCFTHDEKATTDANGEASIRGFYGNYDVTIEAGDKKKKVMVAFHKGYENVLEINIDDSAFDYDGKETDSSSITDSNLPAGGEVVVSSEEALKRVTGKTFTQYASKSDDGVITVKIDEKPEKDTAVQMTSLDVNGKIKAGDVCMFTFKARLLSEGENGQGYIKPFVQAGSDINFQKALFARTTFGSDWTDCYLPFIGIDGLVSAGIRFGGMAQHVEIKDIKIINYGTKVDPATLPSTIIKSSNASGYNAD